ncbi:arsenic resistance N-acetyltransferase ArsN2 [Halovivax sp.]|uniref:arsenic resistance N-acetyltransferase ArsN2 n=1 Tax=Halovivax sp. TaxID=1935978 RepID=UPI0025C721A5|nr:arsenic resistance N-acetyltransferase ArsN2 [Halovivax sp.]
MTDASLSLRPASHDDDIARVEALLGANDLPSADVRAGPARFFLASVGGETIGCGGLERYGSDGLLRSIVVERSSRGNGYGGAIVDALEAEASRTEIETLYLLTTTAADFFADRGYVTIERADVPRAIGETDQFAEFCPSSAVCMRTSTADVDRGL